MDGGEKLIFSGFESMKNSFSCFACHRMNPKSIILPSLGFFLRWKRSKQGKLLHKPIIYYHIPKKKKYKKGERRRRRAGSKFDPRIFFPFRDFFAAHKDFKFLSSFTSRDMKNV